MKNMFTIFLVLLLLSGCSVNQTFVRANERYFKVVIPRHREYIKNNKSLEKQSKKIRLRTLDKWAKLLKDAKKAK